MKSHVFFILLINFCFAQKQIIIIDSSSGKPISYASIWDENKHFKTTDSLGVFTIDDNFKSKIVKITALGFEDKISNLLENEIYLSPKTILLKEIIIAKRKSEKKLKLGKSKRYGSIMCAQYDSKSGIVAKFFPNANQENIFLSKIKLYSNSTDKNRIFSILLYSVTENGEPNEILNTENIICRPKKGSSLNAIDVSDLNILFPKEGVFVAINYMLLEQNKNYDKESNHPLAFFYEPCFYINYVDEYKDTWYFIDDKWNKNSVFSLNISLKLVD